MQSGSSGGHDPQAVLHVHDLPQLYQKPSAAALRRTLDLLRREPTAFAPNKEHDQPRVAEPGVPRYLTSIVASDLRWIDDDDARESIWAAASARLSERAGRTARPSLSRGFAVTPSLAFTVHEPSLTGDDLGLKTWTSALLLSRHLPDWRTHVPPDCHRVLELGAGTGLVGMAAACVWQTHVLLTDLPEIVPNLQRNIEANRALIEQNRGSAETRVLDWADEADVPQTDDEKYMVIVAADPIYSAEHPTLLVKTVDRWMAADARARFIVELPLRERYAQERQQLQDELDAAGFELVLAGTDVGYDDWQGRDGSPAQVECWWSIWTRSIRR